MFPIRDHNPSDRRPFVTWALIAINVVVFLSYYPSLSGNERLLHVVLRRLGAGADRNGERQGWPHAV
jgi:hypothetical protein